MLPLSTLLSLSRFVRELLHLVSSPFLPGIRIHGGSCLRQNHGATNHGSPVFQNSPRPDTSVGFRFWRLSLSICLSIFRLFYRSPASPSPEGVSSNSGVDRRRLEIRDFDVWETDKRVTHPASWKNHFASSTRKNASRTRDRIVRGFSTFSWNFFLRSKQSKSKGFSSFFSYDSYFLTIFMPKILIIKWFISTIKTLESCILF